LLAFGWIGRVVGTHTTKDILRTDLFREEFLGFPDASKLQAPDSSWWKAQWLYQLLIKRLANSVRQ